MKRTPLVRRTPLRRSAPTGPSAEERLAVFTRDGGCIALRYDPSHACQGPLTFAHVPEAGRNGLGMKPPHDRYHGVAECLAANSGGTRPWSETHRDLERAHLAKFYPEMGT